MSLIHRIICRVPLKKVAPNNWTNTLDIATKVLPLSTFHHAKFRQSVWKKRVNLATNCAQNRIQSHQFAQGDLNLLWKAPWSQQIALHVESIILYGAMFTIHKSVWSMREWNFILKIVNLMTPNSTALEYHYCRLFTECERELGTCASKIQTQYCRCLEFW